MTDSSSTGVSDTTNGITSGLGGPLPIPKLTTSTFLPWKRQVMMLLKLRGLVKAVERKAGEEVDENTEIQAMLLILGTCDDEHRIQLQGEATAMAMMNALELQYSDKSEANKYRLLGTYMRATKFATHSINQHIGRMKEMRAQLASVGETQTDGAFQVAVIMSLPTEFGDVMHDWDLLHSSMKTTEFLVSFLQNREKELATKTSAALAVQPYRKPYEQLSIEEKKKVSSCKICRKKGHWGRECPQNPDKPAEVAKDRITAHVALSLGDLGNNLTDKWLLDSGASSHMSNTSSVFSKLSYLQNPKLASVGNGEKVKIIGIGDVVLKSVGEDGVTLLTLYNVSYIPELATNLLSVGAAAKKGIRTTFCKNECVMSLEGKPIAKGKLLEDTLYVLDLTPFKDTNMSLLVTGDTTMSDVHCSLGHPGTKIINQVLQDQEKKQVTSIGCGACAAGKGTKVPHPTSTRETAVHVGQRVHLDLGAFPMKPNLAFSYFLVAKDESSEFSFIYNLKSKSDTAKTIARLIIDFEVQSGQQIKMIHSDNGSEFLNRNTELLFLKEKIAQSLSAPYVPQQNGVAEREIRSIKEKARTMLIESGLGLELAHEAIATACYIKNRLPTHRSKISPYERFTGKAPRIDNITKFGTQVQVIENGSYLTAFDPKTTNGYLVGYTNRFNTFRVYIPSAQRVMESCDVIFAPHYPNTRHQKDCQPSPGEVMIQNVTTKRNSGVVDSSKDKSHREQCQSMSWDDEVMDTENEQRSSTPLEPETPTSEGRKTITGPELDQFFEEFRVASATDRTVQGELENIINRCESALSEPESPSFSTITEISRSGDTSAGGEEDVTIRENTPPELPPRTYPRAMCVYQLDIDDPATYEEATTGSNSQQWKEAINEELRAHEENGTWVKVPRPKQGTTLSARWIFTTKRNIVGEVERYKARLVARGFEQVQGRDFYETYAPVSRLETIRMMLALVAAFELNYIQFDVSTAFLNGVLEEEIYIEPPTGVIVDKNSCLKLIKALYGLKQAPRAWNNKLKQELASLGFRSSDSDQCVFRNREKKLMVLIYVDDGLIIGKSTEACMEMYTALSSLFKLKLLSGDKFVGLEIKRTPDGISVSQEQYTLETVERFHCDLAKPTTGPAADIRTIVAESPQQELRDSNKPYRELLGCLMYLANSTRPDILYVVNWLARFAAKPQINHWHGLGHVLRYLKGTSNYALHYQSGIRSVRIYSDADHASPLTDRYSTSGTIIFMANGPIIFSSRKQTTIAQSSTESEYIAANEAIKEAAWVTQFLDELEISLPKPVLFVDNQSTIKQIKNGDTKRRSKHVELRYHYVRKQFQNGLFDIDYVETQKQPADLLTKPLGGKRIRELLMAEKILVPLHKCTRIGSRVKGPLTSSILMMLLVLVLATQTTGLGFKPVDTKLWTPSEKTVTTGVVSQRIEYFVVSPCSLAHISGWDSEQEVKRKSFEQLKNECQTFFDTNIKKTLRELSQCTEVDNLDSAIGRTHKRGKSREKRSPAMAAAAIMTVVAVGSSIVQAAYSEWSPNSSNNRLKVLEGRVDTLERVNKLIEKTQESAFEIRDSLIGNVTILHNRVESNRKALDQMAKSSASVSWNAADLRVNLEHLNTQLIDISSACNDRTTVPSIYSDLFRLPQIKSLKRKDTILDKVEMSEKGVLIIDFYYDRQPNDTKIYKIEAIPHYVNVTTDPVLVDYSGPPYILFNESADCTRGLREYDFHDGRTTLGCERDNWYDRNLNLWSPTDLVDNESTDKAKPQIYRTRKATIVYCLYHQIIIWGKELLCPHYPFEVNLREPFLLPNLSHIVQQQVMESTQFISRITTPDLDIHGTDADYMRETKALQALKEKNDLSIRAGIFTVEKNTLTIPFNVSTLVYMLGVLGTVITISTFMKNIICRGSQPTESTQVNIINEQGPVDHALRELEPLRPRYPSLESCNSMTDRNPYVNHQTDKTHHYDHTHTLRGSVEKN